MSAAWDRITQALSARGYGRSNSKGGMNYSCPTSNHANGDRSKGLWVSIGNNGSVVLNCPNGCSHIDILGALGLTEADLYDPDSLPEHPNGRPLKYGNEPIVKWYDYTDDKGTLLYAVGRTATKQFPLAHPNGGAQWNWGAPKNAKRYPYRISEFLTKPLTQEIHLVEGEKDADAVFRAGGIGTTFPGGTGQIRKGEFAFLYGRKLRVVVDRDEAGDKWANQIRERLAEHCELTFVQARVGKDVSDHIEAGHSLSDLIPYGKSRFVRATSMSKIEPDLIDWLWDGRIPLGAITLLAGREGVGKSTIAADIAARVSVGDVTGELQGEPHGAGLICVEDAFNVVVRPRLEAAKADLEKCYKLTAVDQAMPDSDVVLSLPTDLDELKATVADNKIRVLVIDPLMSTLKSTIDTHVERSLRTALDPLARFAEESGVAIIGLIHVNKGVGTDALNAIMGSRAFTAVARSVLFAMVDPDDDHGDRYLFGHIKCNAGAKQATVGYRIMPITFPDPKRRIGKDGREREIKTSRIKWGDDDPRTINEALTPKDARATQPVGDQSAAVTEWIIEQGRYVPISEIQDQFPDILPGTLRQMLARQATRGALKRHESIRGHYGPP